MKHLNLLLILLLISTICFSQNKPLVIKGCAASKSLNISTGQSNQIGSIDNNWMLMNMPPLNNGVPHPSNISIPNSYIIQGHNAWANINVPYLNVMNTHSFGLNNANVNQPWLFRRYFCVDKKTTIKINGQFAIDDQGSLSIHDVNGNQNIIISTLTNGFQNPTPINGSMNLNPGLHYIEVKVLNTGSTSMGFSVNASLSSSVALLTDSNQGAKCCASGVLSIEKIIDNNCNGKLDKGDIAGSGWSFKITKNGTTIGQVSTNQFGEAYVNGLTAGTYTITEQNKSGFYAYNNETTKQITIKENGIAKVTFFNCKGELPPKPEVDLCCPPITREEFMEMLSISGDMQTHSISFTPTLDWRNRMQAYTNWRYAMDPCLESFSFNITIRKPVAGTIDNFDYAQNTIVGGIWIAFKANDPGAHCWVGNGTTYNDNTHTFNGTFPSNRWHRIHPTNWFNPNTCPGWDDGLCDPNPRVGFKYSLQVIQGKLSQNPKVQRKMSELFKSQIK